MFDRYEDKRQIVFGGVFQEELKQEGVQRTNEVLFESASVHKRSDFTEKL